ncbi:MAG: 4Fe-4S dicluster domain-containing protein [Candidatus Methylomirabilales bacterium]
MVNYSFVVDHRRCIGCHACSVACKEENGVPLGAYRTWVKYIEKGKFPDTRRYFTVLRCNHCDDAPCIRICPTKALFRRPDGIVDFDPKLCIGCKSCMQACPYDALYIDPNSNTAAKCHFCAHRVEVGLRPACEIVCPTQAIISGDLDDPHSVVSRLVASQVVHVRKPEQGTKPKVFYIQADASGLTPTATAQPATYMWAQAHPSYHEHVQKAHEAKARTVYNVEHTSHPWGLKVAAYLWTKSIAAGALLVAALAPLLRWPQEPVLFGVAAPSLSLGFLLLTTCLLIIDLKRPDRFHYILLHPNPSSWLVWGAWILMAFGLVASGWLAGGLMGSRGLLDLLRLPGGILAAAAAGYSALLFGQAEGRDFWQSPLLLWHLLVAAVLSGAACLLLLGQGLGLGAVVWRLSRLLTAALIVNVILIAAELFGPHANQDAHQAAHLVTRGPFRASFWGGVVLAGTLLPLLLLTWGEPTGLTFVGLLTLVGLGIYEYLWVKAGQVIPLS